MKKHRYLFWLSSSLADFRLAELEATFSTVCRGGGRRWSDALVGVHFPFASVLLDSDEQAVALARRTTAVHCVFQQLAMAACGAQLHSQVRAMLADRNSSVAAMCASTTPHRTFRVCVQASHCRLSHAYKLARIADLSYLPLDGTVQLDKPDLTVHYIEQYSDTPSCAAAGEEVPAPAPCRVFLARWLADGPRAMLASQSLKRRVYIGNTSLEPALALIMANLARVRPGCLVLDPFVGTGSTLVAAATVGAHVLGVDIDYLTVHARTRPSRAQERGCRRRPDEAVASNLRQYGVGDKMLDVLVADASMLRQLLATRLKVDAVVADPPYGIRERNRRVGVKQTNGGEDSRPVPEQYRHSHVPVKVAYCAGQVYADLLQLSAERLTLGGRLVAWLPVNRQTYSSEHVPQHPCLRVVANCEQPLTRLTSRRLVAWQKWREPQQQNEDCASVHQVTAQFTRLYFESLRAQKT